MRHVTCLALVILIGCGSNGGSPHHDARLGPMDMAKLVDAPSDAPPDAIADAPFVPGTSTHYVLDRVLLPENNTQARDYGLDLDNDMVVDNRLGMVISVLSGMGFEAQTDMDRMIDRGSIIMLGNVRGTSLVNSTPASFTIYQGINPVPPACTSAQDTICRKHLAGTGAFTIDPSILLDPPLIGSISNGQLTAGPGHLTIRFVFMGSAPITVTLIGAHVQLAASSAGLTGKLGGAITQTDVNMNVLPPMRDGFEATVMKECTMLTSPPSCGCPGGSTGNTLIGLFDTNQNCSISLGEVQNNSLIVSLFVPDVTVEGKQALSFGVSVTAVPGTYNDPM